MEERKIHPRHLSPHATFGDDPSGYCGCAGCEPREDCGCRSCLPFEWEWCTEECPEDCMADHAGEE